MNRPKVPKKVIEKVEEIKPDPDTLTLDQLRMAEQLVSDEVVTSPVGEYISKNEMISLKRNANVQEYVGVRTQELIQTSTLNLSSLLMKLSDGIEYYHSTKDYLFMGKMIEYAFKIGGYQQTQKPQVDKDELHKKFLNVERIYEEK